LVHLKSFINYGTNWLMATKNEKNALNKIAELGCILCSEVLGFEGTPPELHHIRRHGGKRSASPVIPLCPEHHRGNSGVHGLGHKGFANKWGVTEEELLERVNQKLGKGNE
jgi:Recombination enhancement, RecA-dependent nuclease